MWRLDEVVVVIEGLHTACVSVRLCVCVLGWWEAVYVLHCVNGEALNWSHAAGD